MQTLTCTCLEGVGVGWAGGPARRPPSGRNMEEVIGQSLPPT